MLSVLKKLVDSAAFNLAAAMIIVGSSVVCGKTITQDFPLFLASELRFLIAAALFLPLGVYRRSLFCLPRQDWLRLSLMAFCGQILFTLLLLLGLRYTSAINAGTLTGTTPVFMALFSFFILGERFNIRQIAALLLACGSIFLLNYDAFHELPGTGSRQWLGNLFVLAAVASEAVFLLLGKKLQTPLSGLSLTALLSLLGAVFCLLPALIAAYDFNFSALRIDDIGAILYFSAIYTNLAYLLWFRGAARASGAAASIFTSLMPLSAAFLSVWLLAEPVTPRQIVALASAMIAILMLNVCPPARKEACHHEGT